MKELKVDKSWNQIEIKSEGISSSQLTEMKKMAGSYEALFSRRAMKYRSMGLNEMELKEQDYKKYIVKEYTFLNRPVVIVGQDIFIGSGKNNIIALKERLKK